jgi:TorA maturation chaperone TorD
MAQFDLNKGLAREDLCRFLAACYYQPSPEFAEERIFESMANAASRIDPELEIHAHSLGEQFAAAGVDSLLLDYTRLFLGPTHILAKPYGSIWLEGDKTVMGNTTVAVQKLYGDGGFDLADDFRELPDHIAAELEFLYLLIHRENDAHRNGKADALEEILSVRKRLLDEHLGCWVEPFAAAVRAGAQSDFYRGLADMTERFVGMEAARGRHQ